MIRSLWRASHFALALISSLFLIVASVTGAILALEPINDARVPIARIPLDDIPLAETLAVLQKEYTEVFDLERDPNDRLLATVVHGDGTDERIYVHPRTGKKLGIPHEQSLVFQWATNLHRSLFLKTTGRIFVGVISFLLFLIALTGAFLLVERQGGPKKAFSKVPKIQTGQKYHVVLGRWFFIPILIIAATGVFLSAEKFSLLPEDRATHTMPNISHAQWAPGKNTIAAPLFSGIGLLEIRTLNFPFSDAPEDYFELALKDRELFVHQYTGEIISEAPYPWVVLASRLSFDLHTGRGSIFWSLVLLATSISILFFLYTGMVMAFGRIKKERSLKVRTHKDASDYIILVGSETGGTHEFANGLFRALVQAGQRVHKAGLNKYTTYREAKHIIVLTATYGEGEAPNNARNFESAFASIRPLHPMKFSVVGFGSLQYPQYCGFAEHVYTLFQNHGDFHSGMALEKINNQSHTAFMDWAARWAGVEGFTLDVDTLIGASKKHRKAAFRVESNAGIQVDDTFLLRLRPPRSLVFSSGDLLSYTPNESEPPRFYSIAKWEGDIVLSVKRHQFGICSNALSGLRAKQKVRAMVKTNPNFHFPNTAPEVICIANGTGIAPFIGMVWENKGQIPISLFWGGRTKASLMPYSTYLDTALEEKELSALYTVYSKEGGPSVYVQDLLRKEAKSIAVKLVSGTVFMICGSLKMQAGVLGVLEEIALQELHTPLSTFEEGDQIRTDCY